MFLTMVLLLSNLTFGQYPTSCIDCCYVQLENSLNRCERTCSGLNQPLDCGIVRDACVMSQWISFDQCLNWCSQTSRNR